MNGTEEINGKNQAGLYTKSIRSRHGRALREMSP